MTTAWFDAMQLATVTIYVVLRSYTDSLRPRLHGFHPRTKSERLYCVVYMKDIPLSYTQYSATEQLQQLANQLVFGSREN